MLPDGKIEEFADFVFDYRDRAKEDYWSAYLPDRQVIEWSLTEPLQLHNTRLPANLLDKGSLRAGSSNGTLGSRPVKDRPDRPPPRALHDKEDARENDAEQ